MKLTTSIIAANLVAILCVGIAGYLLLNDKTGWGWFLFVGIISMGTVKISSDKDDEEEADSKTKN